MKDQPYWRGNPDSKVQGAYMGPTWGRQDPGGPHVGPMILVIWECMVGGCSRKWYSFVFHSDLSIIKATLWTCCLPWLIWLIWYVWLNDVLHVFICKMSISMKRDHLQWLVCCEIYPINRTHDDVVPHFEAETKLPPFRRGYFHKHFRERKCLHFA